MNLECKGKMVELMSKLAFVYWQRKAHNEATKTEENSKLFEIFMRTSVTCHMSRWQPDFRPNTTNMLSVHSFQLWIWEPRCMNSSSSVDQR